MMDRNIVVRVVKELTLLELDVFQIIHIYDYDFANPQLREQISSFFEEKAEEILGILADADQST